MASHQSKVTVFGCIPRISLVWINTVKPRGGLRTSLVKKSSKVLCYGEFQAKVEV